MSDHRDDPQRPGSWPPPPPPAQPEGESQSGWSTPAPGPPPGQPQQGGWGTPPPGPPSPPHSGSAAWGPAPGYQPGYAPAAPVPPPEGGLLENAVRVLASPVDTLRRVTAHPRTSWSIILIVVIGALTVVAALAGADAVGPPGAPGDPFAADLGGLRPVLIAGGLVFGPLVTLGFVAFWAAVLLGLARLFKGTGTYAATFSGLAFSYVPAVLSIPFQLLPLALGFAGSLLASFASFGVSIWSLVLMVIAVREAHRVTTGRAVAVVLIPIAVVVALVLLVVVFLVALVLGGLAGMS